MSKQNVFVQFTYCALCQLNHRKGKKHAFSKRHQEIVTNILKKFEKKVSGAKVSLASPTIQGEHWPERDSMFWCYFCQMDVAKHARKYSFQGDCIAVNGGFLEHLTRSDHAESAVKFLRENLMNLKRTQTFTLASKDYLKYLEECEKACNSFLSEKASLIEKEATRIRYEESVRHHLVSTSKQQTVHSDAAADRSTANLKFHALLTPTEVERKKTARAFGEGLTAIDRSQEDDSVGNIYSNAPPPWLLPDTAEDKSATVASIKPDLEDLERHKKLMKKAKLNPNRVGAKFDRQEQKSESWLPNFGGVWNHGRRTKSGEQFQRRTTWKGKTTASSTATATIGSDPVKSFVNESNEKSVSPMLYSLREADNQAHFPPNASGTKTFSHGPSIQNTLSGRSSSSDETIRSHHHPESTKNFTPSSFPHYLNGFDQPRLQSSNSGSRPYQASTSTNHFSTQPDFDAATPTSEAMTVKLKPYARKRKLPPGSGETHSSDYPSGIRSLSADLLASQSGRLVSSSQETNSRQLPFRLLSTPVIDQHKAMRKKM